MCDCLEKLDEKLQETHPGTSIGRLFLFSRDSNKTRTTAAITMEDGPSQGRGKPRVKAPQIIPTYCPFCGVKYDE